MPEGNNQKLIKLTSSRLGKRFAILIVLISSCFTLLSTSLQLALDYHSDISRIEQQFTNIRTSYLQAITLSVWSLDDSQIQTQLLGLSQLPDIEYVAIKLEERTQWQKGKRLSNATKETSFPLVYDSQGIPPTNIGTLHITASIDNVYQRLINKAGVILVSNGIKTFLVSSFILLLVWRLITRHLKAISDYLTQLELNNLSPPLQLDKNIKHNKPDEIDSVAESINLMRSSLHDSYHELNRAKVNLQKLVLERDQLLIKEQDHKEHLEELVSERTEQLETSLTDLQSAQDLLIETEKMAALGNMVAGVAHEINTPIGVCRTAASFQGEGSQLIRQKMKDGTLTQNDLEEFLDDIKKSSELFESNIIKASDLISNFKLIATDQSSDIKHRFNLQEYLNASIETIYPQFKHHNVHFHINVPADIYLNSFPGAFHQVLSNLINNSIIHGFDNKDGGSITISAAQEDEQLVLHYRDNGRGLTEEEQKKIFEPFFTSRRGNGGSGLGMSIVFNIITRQLQGRANLITSDESGFHLQISLPVEAINKNTL